MENIVISRDDFKALASRTRTGIIKLLQERNHNLSELSKKLSLSSPTVKQHLGILQKAMLVEQVDEGRKWKYYSLTRKGKNIFAEETPKPLVILLGIATIALAAVLFSMLYSTQYQLQKELGQDASISGATTRASIEQVPEAIAEAVPQQAFGQQAAGTIQIIALAIIAIIEGYLIARVVR